MMSVERCPRCEYKLISGVCPICAGRIVGERTPMLAPLPKAPQKEKPRRRFQFRKPRREANG